MTSFTVGMAGHIDHGKTTLTKALTNINTDRLKEERERNISIEPGFAPLLLDEEHSVSIIDVPGHERFIRQMIAGVAGIDAVIIVIAADEGIMPQTKEHLAILNFLGVHKGIIAITKVDRVDNDFRELVIEEVRDELQGTQFEDMEMVSVDSLTHKGIDILKEKLLMLLENVEARNRVGSFRLPIDQVFTIKGQGTIVRGTVFEGEVHQGASLTILPDEKVVQARQIQVHNETVQTAKAGQRVAINVSQISKDELKRGDVLVSSHHFIVTKTIDVALQFAHQLLHPIKQRMPVNLHVGTSEVTGKIIFFDRNKIEQCDEEVVCQLRLDEDVVVRRGDRFILRRPTPVETIAGGWVINPKGERYRFGEETIMNLLKKKQGTPKQRVYDVLTEDKCCSFQNLIKATSLNEDSLQSVLREELETGGIIEVKTEYYSASQTIEQMKKVINQQLDHHHCKFPMSMGLNKAELIQLISHIPKQLSEATIQMMLSNNELIQWEQYLALPSFTPHYPKQWAKRMEEAVSLLKEDGIQVKEWSEYTAEVSLPQEEATLLKKFLLTTQTVEALTDKMLVHQDAFMETLFKLFKQTDNTFTLNNAKEILGLSRKYVIPYLELLDHLSYTIRLDNERKWLINSVSTLRVNKD
ncbi:selenocysteine-specific translation elongation factor [Bacillus solimangrovi]|uniref:Selenocysteine-specific elongation factor n=1 Tax=Bacillus solimangrovi TaxID=1305675 RepID=A0A1E5LEJ6_9BACI|nr:selenocysteine-specific translation elongation factor [Bacillus solimangrovi]OEH92496.1 selenocysteine-specific translation elongation factor [Bacillus solimangrovi]